MRRILHATRRIQRWHRSWPHWAKDAYGLVAYFNFVELLPTLSAIALAPGHFFRRLPQVLAGKRRMYQTPVKFFFNFASLFLLVFFLRNAEFRESLGESNALASLLLLIPFTPLVMPALGGLAWLLYQAPRLLPGGSFPQPNHHPFALVLSPSAYFKLSPSRFLWGLFYVSIYFLAAWQLAQIAIGANLLATVAVWTRIGDGHIAVKGILILASLVLLAGSIHLLVFRPYGELFRWALRRPTDHAILHDLYPLRESADSFLTAVAETEQETDGQAFSFLFDAFCDELEHHFPAIRGLVQAEYRRQFRSHDWTLLEKSLAQSIRSEEIEHALAEQPESLRARWRDLSKQFEAVTPVDGRRQAA